MKRFLILLLLVSLCGCSMAQIRKAFLGMSAQDVENAKKKYTKIFDLDADYCYDKTLELITDMQARLLGKNRESYFFTANRFDRAYPLCIDTTALGVLIVPLEPGKSSVEVASGNYDLARFVSEKLYAELLEQEKLYGEGKN